MKTHDKLFLRRGIALAFFFLAPLVLYAQYTLIPDPNFEQALIDLGIDSDGVVNGQVLTSDIETVVALDISHRGINDLTGIEDFAALEQLNITWTRVRNVDLTNNSHLKVLIFDRCDKLLSLNISNNPDLEIIRSSGSLLAELDVSNCPKLVELVLGEYSPSDTHGIGYLDLSNSPQLTKLQLVNIALLETVDLRSGNNAILNDVFVECVMEGGYRCEPIVCFMVDDFAAASNNQFPYSEWDADVVFSEDCALGTADFWSETDITLYPNPTADGLVLATSDRVHISEVRRFDINGRLLEVLEFQIDKKVSIDVSHLANGIYFLRIRGNDGNSATKKFVKIK